MLDQVIADWTPDHEDCGLDLAICHPCVRTYLPKAKDQDLAAAEQRGGSKRNKYEGPCRSHKMVFKATVVEVFGAMAPATVEVIKRAAQIVSNELSDGTATTWTARSFSSFHQQRLAMAIQRGNAKAIKVLHEHKRVRWSFIYVC